MTKTTKNAREKQVAIIRSNFLSSLLSLKAEYAVIERDEPAKLNTKKSGIKLVMSIVSLLTTCNIVV